MNPEKRHNTTSKIGGRDHINTENDWIEDNAIQDLNKQFNMTLSNRADNTKSPFNYTQKSSTSQTRYNDIQ